METFVIAVSSIAIAEIGDRTQLLSLALAAHYRRPWPIIAGILGATIANHTVAGLVGAWFGRLLTAAVLDALVGVSMIAMAAWVLRADTLRGNPDVSNRSAFVATLVAFFIAEIGDKTQIATHGAGRRISQSCGGRGRHHRRHADRQHSRGFRRRRAGRPAADFGR